MSKEDVVETIGWCFIMALGWWVLVVGWSLDVLWVGIFWIIVMAVASMGGPTAWE